MSSTVEPKSETPPIINTTPTIEEDEEHASMRSSPVTTAPSKKELGDNPPNFQIERPHLRKTSLIDRVRASSNGLLLTLTREPGTNITNMSFIINIGIHKERLLNIKIKSRFWNWLR
jgi:hypothetical protein